MVSLAPLPLLLLLWLWWEGIASLAGGLDSESTSIFELSSPAGSGPGVLGLLLHPRTGIVAVVS